MQYLTSSDSQILRPGVAVRDGAASATLPASAAPGATVTLLPRGGQGFQVRASGASGAVNGTPAGKPCFRSEVVVAVSAGGSGYSDGDEILVMSGADTVATLAVQTDGAGAVTGVDATPRTDAVAPGAALTVDCTGSGNGDAEATAKARDPNACVRCTHVSGGRWICVSLGADGSSRPL